MAWGGGMPSAGCENCRRVKKRCGLERPACSRCVKQKRTCVGYRDITQLVIRDESERLRQKYEHRQPRQTVSRQSTIEEPVEVEDVLSCPFKKDPIIHIENVESSSEADSSEDDVLPDTELQGVEMVLELARSDLSEAVMSLDIAQLRGIPTKPEDVATTHFFQQFASSGHWDFLRRFHREARTQRHLELAIQACGMAALASVQRVERGKDYACMRYTDALALLNQAIGDPKQAKQDETLVAVLLLGYYENITCDRRQSVKSWQAHIKGAAQLVKMRGKKQFKRPIARQLYRDTRALILSQCIWDDKEPPKFLEEYQLELQAQTPKEEGPFFDIADRLTWLYIRFGKLRAQLSAHVLSDLDGAMQAADLERCLIEWGTDAQERGGPVWEYHETQVEDNEHVWDGKIFVYSSHLAATIWNRWRCLRVMLSRVQELLCQRIVPEEHREVYLMHFRRARKQMSDEICASVPPCLGHGGSMLNSPCALIAAYGCIWPLFFAGSCALERVGYGAWSVAQGHPAPQTIMHSAAYAQAAWILHQLKFIAEEVGLKWADGVASPLRGEFLLKEPAQDTAMVEVAAPEGQPSWEYISSTPIESWIAKITTAYNSPWLDKIEEAYRRHHISEGDDLCYGRQPSKELEFQESCLRQSLVYQVVKELEAESLQKQSSRD